MLDDPVQDETLKANYDRTRRFYIYSRDLADKVAAFHQGVAAGSHQNAVVAVYMRGYYYLSTLAKLDTPSDVQVVNPITRTLFELLMDHKFLCFDQQAHIKYSAFNHLSWIKSSLDLFDFMLENPSVDHEACYEQELEFATDPEKFWQCKTIMVKHYGKHPNEVDTAEKLARAIPENWTGIKGLYERAKKIDDKEGPGSTFVEYYKGYIHKNNWHVHGGSAGVAARTAETLGREWSIAHDASFRLLINLTVMTFKELKLDVLAPTLRADIEALAKNDDLPRRSGEV